MPNQVKGYETLCEFDEKNRFPSCRISAKHTTDRPLGTILHAFSTFHSVRGIWTFASHTCKSPANSTRQTNRKPKNLTKYLIDQQRYESLKANFKKVKIDRLKLKQIVRFSNKNLCYQKSLNNNKLARDRTTGDRTPCGRGHFFVRLRNQGLFGLRLADLTLPPNGDRARDRNR